MATRTFINAAHPDLFNGMVELDKAVHAAGLSKWHHELVKITASQLNGCAYCIDKHTQDALALGIPARKLTLISVAHEVPSHFTEEEQLIIQLTKAVTYIHQHGIEDALYTRCTTAFGEAYTAALIMAITMINAWNRLGISFKLEPKF
jgi:AhpD family alkylhydroperoxidase